MPRRRKLSYDRWVPFAWQGVSLCVPDEWNPGRITGDAGAGDVRLDDAEMARVEIEWKDARGDDRVGAIIDRYVEGLAKTAQKERRPLEVTRPLDVPGLHLPDLRGLECFRWESLFTVHTLAAYSPSADCLVFVRVMARPSEDAAVLLPRILGSLSVAPSGAPRRWALYGLEVTSPGAFVLENHELKSGHLRLEFRSGKTVLQIDRVSLAAILLRNRTLDDWYREFFRKTLRHLAFETHPLPDGAIRIEGRPRGRLQGLLQPLPFWNARPRRNLVGRAFVDEAGNKIMVVQTHYRQGDVLPDFDAVLPRTPAPSAATG